MRRSFLPPSSLPARPGCDDIPRCHTPGPVSVRRRLPHAPAKINSRRAKSLAICPAVPSSSHRIQQRIRNFHLIPPADPLGAEQQNKVGRLSYRASI